MGAQEATSRALALASTPYQQSGTRVDILAGTRVLVSNPYGTSELVLQETIPDNPEQYRTGLVVSLGWTADNTFRTEGRVRRA